MARYPEKLAAHVSDRQRNANMEFLRDRVIETGICGGMDLAWALKPRAGSPRSIDSIIHRQGGVDSTIDIGNAFDDLSRPLRLMWLVSHGSSYGGYSPRPGCQ
jgi:hypothetical protein